MYTLTDNDFKEINEFSLKIKKCLWSYWICGIWMISPTFKAMIDIQYKKTSDPNVVRVEWRERQNTGWAIIDISFGSRIPNMPITELVICKEAAKVI